VFRAPDSTMASIPLPLLRYISHENLEALQAWPAVKIRTDADVEAWKQTQGYSDYSHFLRWLNESVVGCSLPRTNDNQSEVLEILVRRNSRPTSCLDRASTECSACSTSWTSGSTRFHHYQQLNDLETSHFAHGGSVSKKYVLPDFFALFMT
jgi:hypothetical protein